MPFLIISLSAILAGTLLLAKTRKDLPGKFFVFISWFFVVVGFILFIGFIGGAICRISHHCCKDRPEFRHEMMMKRSGHDRQGEGCCPGFHDRKSCGSGPECTHHDSLIKCCPGHTDSDTLKCPMKKK